MGTKWFRVGRCVSSFVELVLFNVNNRCNEEVEDVEDTHVDVGTMGVSTGSAQKRIGPLLD